jgi:Domain of unknown function (DUF4838)/Glycosyl hydrolases family 2, sugar binding domain
VGCAVRKVGLLFGLLLSFARPGRADVFLVRAGKPAAALVLAANAVEDERLAAREIQEHVEKISGARLAISTAAPAGLVPIQVGGGTAPLGLGEDPSSFALVVQPEAVQLRGRTAAGTLIAAYELLEQLGCRWYMPGEIGTVIPHVQTVRLAEQRTLQSPSFPSRHLQGIPRTDPWYRRMRLGGPYFAGAHGLGIKADLATEPELFSLVDGQRKARQWCLSNPEVLRRTVEAVKERLRRDPTQPWFGIGPNDGGGHCECAACRALDAGDWDFFAGQVSKTDRYIHFFNQVLAEVHKEFPGKKLAFYIYADYFRPPVREKPDRDIVPALAPITLCRIHSALNPLCPERGYLGRILDGWSKLLPEIYFRGYYFNLADPGFPFSFVSRVRDEIPLFKSKNVAGFRVECLPAWGSHTPSLYVATRLFWKHDTDVDALLADFATRFFGPAAEPMRRYFAGMDAALHEADYHTGGAVDLPLFHTAEVRRRSRTALDEAKRLAGGDAMVSKRVAMFRLTFDYLEAFLAMREHTTALRFAAARQDLDRMEALRVQAAGHQPPLVDPEKSAEYTRRFWSEAVVQGNERTTGGSEMVAALPDRWDVELDPAQAGEEMGFFRPRPRVDSRMTLATSSASWSDQGLRYYRGAAWYRTRVAIPAHFQGRRLMLWFGGVDEQAKVWVNGKLVGDGPRGAFRPFEFDATEAARSGDVNDVVVRVNNLQLNELGTGGLTGPVMFWAPPRAARQE